MGIKRIKDYTIVTLGSHSALQILKGAKDEGFKTAVVATPPRIPLYKSYDNFIDEVLEINSWKDFPKLEEDLIKRDSVIIPHGSFVAYLGMEENKKMEVPYFGNKKVLDWEENRKMQREWMEESGVKVPHRFKRGDKIDRPVIVKSYGASGGKGYFTARNQKELDEKLKNYNEEKFMVQEYVIGVPLYFSFFYSPLTKKVEIMSIDKRYETNVDSLGRIPAKNQRGLNIEPSFEVVANIPLAVRESLLAEAISMAERVVETSQKLIPAKGLFGPFCLETIITSTEEIYVIEISARIVAGTNCFINGSPYTYLLYDEPMSTGRRIAREIKNAINLNKLKEILD
ncbi:formate--phosphoribosylaminoimidazolecarboxamide ligase [Candidatus Daviesbacteria bacterium]|nr:formate--phosphoribosylaminoimidazolecarboxamide ligase [Candidatus Daviesbacteria bacterium]